MKILITGGSGYIARNLKRLLINNGDKVSAPSHSQLDLLNSKILEEYLSREQFDVIIHTASNGGKRGVIDTFENTYVPNMLMYENLCACRPNQTPIITFGSGAEFDRRRPVRNEYASSILFNFPLDPYGLSKNMITRRAITYGKNIWVLRLFGCFNYDEDNSRFIKSCILCIKENRPIIIHQQKTMDFFFLDDIIPVLRRIFKNIMSPGFDMNPTHVNLTYIQKHGLIGIAQMIAFQMKNPHHEIIIENPGIGPEYTGDGGVLSSTGIPLVGLNEGIRRTINELI